MGETAEQVVRLEQVARPAWELEAPAWASQLVAAATAPWSPTGAGLEERELSGEGWRLVSVRVPAARRLRAAELEERTRQAYQAVAGRLADRAERHVVRMWNYIPGILEPLDGLDHRYMAFNAGRHRAFEEWFAGRRRFDRTVPTASGVGHDGDDFVVHCLAAAAPGRPVENPRQVPSYCYSQHYGPLPPCFARATLVDPGPDGRPWLLVGGTASVVGEESVHRGDLEAQVEETLANLAALLTAGLAAAGLARPPAPRRELLARFFSVRVYHPPRVDPRHVTRLLAGAFAASAEVQVLVADLCRAPLEVEVEGVAALG